MEINKMEKKTCKYCNGEIKKGVCIKCLMPTEYKGKEKNNWIGKVKNGKKR